MSYVAIGMSKYSQEFLDKVA